MFAAHLQFQGLHGFQKTLENLVKKIPDRSGQKKWSGQKKMLRNYENHWKHLKPLEFPMFPMISIELPIITREFPMFPMFLRLYGGVCVGWRVGQAAESTKGLIPDA